jgi:ssDNA-binding Zn-finger/Zn-ribbon topoisomerase 1
MEGRKIMRFKLPYGLKNGELIHISTAEKGLKCQCVCPGCGHPLIARKGPKTTHHFAHAQNSECAKGIETALHLSAKEILQKHQKLMLPKVEVEFNSYRPNWLVSQEIFIEFDEVKLEYRMDTIVPDVIVMVKGRPLMIEITVTHKTGEAKVEKIKQMGISCLEVDLSSIKGELTIEELENMVIEKVEYKKWLHNEKATLYKEKALSFAVEKSSFKRGGSFYVDACPIRTKKYHGRSTPGANVFNECLYCEYCLQIGDGEGYGSMSEGIHCTGDKEIKNIEDILVHKSILK